MADGGPRGGSYIRDNYQISRIGDGPGFYDPDAVSQGVGGVDETNDRWYKPWTWGSNNNWMKPWDWESVNQMQANFSAERERSRNMTPEQRQANEDALFAEWNNSIALEEGMSPSQRQIQAEAGFNPWREFMSILGGAEYSRAAGVQSIGASEQERQNISRNLGGIQRELSLSSRRVDDRRNAVGGFRTTMEMLAPPATIATMAIPTGAGFRMLPTAVQTSRVGRVFAPATGAGGRLFEWAGNRAMPAYLMSEAASNEIPGQALRNVAEEGAGTAAAMTAANLIINRWPLRRGRTFATFLGAGTAGLGTAAVVGDALDRQRVSAAREYAFRDQERLNYIYNRNPEYFPEFIPNDRLR